MSFHEHQAAVLRLGRRQRREVLRTGDIELDIILDALELQHSSCCCTPHFSTRLLPSVLVGVIARSSVNGNIQAKSIYGPHEHQGSSSASAGACGLGNHCRQQRVRGIGQLGKRWLTGQRMRPVDKQHSCPILAADNLSAKRLCNQSDFNCQPPARNAVVMRQGMWTTSRGESVVSATVGAHESLLTSECMVGCSEFHLPD